MKNLIILGLLLCSSIPSFCQEFPITWVAGKTTRVNLEESGDMLTVSMVNTSNPASHAKYQINVCDINFVGGTPYGEAFASYSYSYTQYYFLYVTFALKPGASFKVLEASGPYYPENPQNYANGGDGNAVWVADNCHLYDDNWNRIKDESCKTIYFQIQAFEDNVEKLYQFRNRLLNKLKACGSGKIVYKKYCFSCKEERFVQGKNPSFNAHLNDCEPNPMESVQFDTQEEVDRFNNNYYYDILPTKNGPAQKTAASSPSTTSTSSSQSNSRPQVLTPQSTPSTQRQQQMLEQANIIMARQQEKSRQIWDVQNAVAGVVSELQKDNIRKRTRDAINRRDKAFADLQKEIRKGNVESLNQCVACSGDGLTTCITCSGNPFKTCSYCSGSGRVQSFGNSTACVTCYGSGQIACKGCGGMGFDLCDRCYGNGHDVSYSFAGSAAETKKESPSVPAEFNIGYHGKKAIVVAIGNQYWIDKNLNVDHFANGSLIPQSKNQNDWKKAFLNQEPRWAYVEYDSSTGSSYGKFYNWFAVSDRRGVCPAGWHVPDEDEWKAMIDVVGKDQAVQLMSKEWKGSEGTDKYGFNAVPAGYTLGNNSMKQGKEASWWSSTDGYSEVFRSKGPHVFSVKDGKIMELPPVSKVWGYSVRCISD